MADGLWLMVGCMLFVDFFEISLFVGGLLFVVSCVR